MDSAATLDQAFEYDMVKELLGAINEAPEEDHGKILKSFLLNGIEQMREHTIFQLDLVEKLAFIALNNVQDVRLYSLEARVKELEDGKPVTFGQIMGELFFALAVEAAILGGVTFGASAVAGAGALLLSNIRTTIRAPRFTYRRVLTKRAKRIVDEARRDLAKSEQRLLTRLYAPMPRGSTRAIERTAWRKRKVANKADALELADVRRKIYHMDRNREFNIQELVDAHVPFDQLPPQFQDLDAAEVSGKIAAFIDNYAHHVDAGKSAIRAFSLLAQKDYPDAFLSDTAPVGETVESFTTTGAIMEMLRECESFKLDVALHYAQLRAIIDAVAEDEIFDAFETILVLEDLDNNLPDVIDLSELMLANLEFFVAPMELAVWLLYLEANNVLERDTAPTRKLTTVGGYGAESTRFIGDDFVIQVLSSTVGLTDSPRTTYEGRSYQGLHVLDEYQAYYLFHKFAKNAFVHIADRIPVSKNKELGDFIHKDVAAKAFDDVLSQQKVFFFSGENKQRRDLVNEMSIVVIEFFNFVRERAGTHKAFGFSDAIPEGTVISTLLDRIEPPDLTPALADEPAPVTFNDWKSEQEKAQAAEWEARTLGLLDALDIDFIRALQHFQYLLAIKEKYKEPFGEEAFNDLFLDQAEAELLSIRSAVEVQIDAIRSDRTHASDAVTSRANALEEKIFNSEVGRQMHSVFDGSPFMTGEE